MTELDLIIDLHKDKERQGPGSDLDTLRALDYVSFSGRTNIKIADLGCGSGASTIVLAKKINAHISAIDLFGTFLEKLKTNSSKEILMGKVETLERSMDNLPFEKESLDLIWAEGSIYNIGFNNGIENWKPFLKKGGYLAVSEITWISESRPSEIEHFWNKAYPEIDTAGNKIKTLENCGYNLEGYFYLSEESWLENYYKPLEDEFDDFLKRHEHSFLALKVVQEHKAEMDMYLKFKDYYSYGFYIAKKLD